LIEEIIMRNITYKIKTFLINQQGGETAEWAVIVGILVAIGVAVYGPTGGLGAAIGTVVGSVSAAIAG